MWVYKKKVAPLFEGRTDFIILFCVVFEKVFVKVNGKHASRLKRV